MKTFVKKAFWCMVVGWFVIPLDVMAVSLDMASDHYRIKRGESFTVDITVDKPDDMTGVAVSLIYPKRILTLDPTPVTSDFFAPSSAWAANTEKTGVVALAGHAFNPAAQKSGGPGANEQTALFSVHFRVKDNAKLRRFKLKLKQTVLCNGPAGWGTDHNNNGEFDKVDKDMVEKAPLLYASRYDESGLVTDIVLASFAIIPKLSLKVIAGRGQTVNPDNDDGQSGQSGSTDSAPDAGPGQDITTGRTIVNPAPSAVDVSLCPVLEVSLPVNAADDDTGSDAHIVWQVSRDSDFSDLVFEATRPADRPTLQVPELILEDQTTYFWRVRVSDTDEPAAMDSFTTCMDDRVDLDQNGILDTQDVDAADNLILDTHPEIEGFGLKVVQADNGDVQFGLVSPDVTVQIEKLKWSDTQDTVTAEGAPLDFPIGVLTFRITTASPGDTAAATLYFSDPLKKGYECWTMDPQNGWMDASLYITFGKDMTSAEIHVTDGGPGDADGVANGVIITPSGFVKHALRKK